MSTDFKVVIPARYQSSRFPGKPLAPICGKPMILHACDRALESGASEVVVATDSEDIRSACEASGADVCMTSATHATGTDRIAEVVAIRNWSDDAIIVNVQGDEPLLPSSVIQQVAGNLKSRQTASIATLATPVTDRSEAFDPNVVKVVFDNSGTALYFSRATIPAARDGGWAIGQTFRHVGVYAFRGGFLRRFTNMQEATIERLEKLEQLRALWHGERIHVSVAVSLPGPGVDTPEQLRQVEDIMRAQR